MSEPKTITDFEFHFTNGDKLFTQAIGKTFTWSEDGGTGQLVIKHEDGSIATFTLFRDKLNAMQVTERVEVEPQTVLDVNGVVMMGE